MMRKKFAALGLALMLTVSLTACGGGSSAPASSAAPAAPATSEAAAGAAAGGEVKGLEGPIAESPILLKFLWGGTTGFLCVLMVCTKGIDGIKQLCNVGGFLNAFIFVVVIVAWVKIMLNPKKYDTFKEDYDENGKPIPSSRLPYEGYDPDKKQLWITKKLDGVK